MTTYCMFGNDLNNELISARILGIAVNVRNGRKTRKVRKAEILPTPGISDKKETQTTKKSRMNQPEVQYEPGIRFFLFGLSPHQPRANT